jgi:hypothetical protein
LQSGWRFGRRTRRKRRHRRNQGEQPSSASNRARVAPARNSSFMDSPRRAGFGKAMRAPAADGSAPNAVASSTGEGSAAGECGYPTRASSTTAVLNSSTSGRRPASPHAHVAVRLPRARSAARNGEDPTRVPRSEAISPCWRHQSGRPGRRRPGPPQIRTCGLPASGSSHHGFADRGHPFAHARPAYRVGPVFPARASAGREMRESRGELPHPIPLCHRQSS